MDIRPRTLGEILDDAWRLALADAPLLLLFNMLFLIPAFVFMLLLLAQPAPSGIAQCVLPALAALLLPLTGLASAACQELFRRRTVNKPADIRDCLTAALRHSPEHAAARAVLLCLTLPGPLLLIASFLPDTSPIVRFFGFLFGTLLTFLLSLPLWGACTSLHVLLSADAARSGTLLRELRRDVAAAAGKAAVLVLIRLPLLFLLAVQLHVLAKVVFWTADNLGGFDTSLLDVEWAFLENPVYTTALFLLSWLLLAPFFEGGNFLLHTDIRTRQEGLDLQYRVQHAFGGSARATTETSPSKQRGAKIGSVLMVMGLLLFCQPAAQAREELATVRSVRQEIETIRTEIRKAEPYPGGKRWLGRLRGLQAKLARMSGGNSSRVRWFEGAIADFADRKREDALRILDDLHHRLSLLEDSLTASRHDPADEGARRSPEDIKSLLRGSEGRKIERGRSGKQVEEERREVRREEDPANGPRQPGGGGDQPANAGRSPSVSGGGLSILGWLLLGGLAVAVVVVGLLLYLNSPRSPRTPKPPAVSGADNPSPDSDARQMLEESPAALWRQADALADEGRFREAVRVLYLAVLALLHRQHFIRFELTRTNGEYVRQVRLSEQAPPELHEPFQRLTNRFETAWYGDRPCDAGSYSACRTLADEMQQRITFV